MGSLEQGERTRAVYEDLPGYLKPPLVPVRDVSDPEFFWPFDVGRSGPSRIIANLFAHLSGYAGFMRRLPDSLEERLRSTNLRLPVLFSPVVSATAAMEDDLRSPGPFLRAATLVLAARRFHDDLRSGKLPLDKVNGKPLEMGQYANAFGTSVVVEDGRVRIFKTVDVEHILVLIRGRMYVVNIGGPAGLLSASELARALALISNAQGDGVGSSPEVSPGVLTFVSDGTQMKAFRELNVSVVNRDSLHRIRHTLLTLCLDLDEMPGSHEEAAFLAHSRNSGNRWFHSSFQIVVFGNARACGIFSFTAYIDGNIMMRIASEVQRQAAEIPSDGVARPAAVAPADLRPLRFDVRPEIVRQAEEEAERYRDNQRATFTIEGVGREIFVRKGISPIQAFVVALELTARETIGSCVNIEQFLTVSAFRCMDLVAAHVAGKELRSFVERVAAGRLSPGDAMGELKRTCSDLEDITRSARQYLPIDTALSLFMASRGKAARWYLGFGLALFMRILELSGGLKRVRREVVISHPAIYSGVPVLGRPGVKLPYGRYFGLHYQIHEDRTVITVMPGINWNIPNEKLIGLLREKLLLLVSFLEDASPTAPGSGMTLHRHEPVLSPVRRVW